MAALVSHLGPDSTVESAGYSPWGPCELGLDLPSGKVHLRGLSHTQADSLRRGYAGFLVDTALSGAKLLRCSAYRLTNSPGLPEKDLTRDGQYTPLKNRQNPGPGFSLTGVNFVARVEPCPGSAASSIGIVNEEELAQPIVIENFLRVISAHGALRQGGVMLHSAGLVIGNRAYLFCGRSNAGKTTLTRKAWKMGARVLSDDINLVMPAGEEYRAHAVPFTGEFGRTLDQPEGQESFPVAGLVLLEQGKHLGWETVTKAEAVASLMAGCPFVNDDEQASSLLFDALLGLVSALPVIRLKNRKEDSMEGIFSVVEAGLTAIGESRVG